MFNKCSLCRPISSSVIYESKNFFLIKPDFVCFHNISIVPKKHYNYSFQIKNLEEIIELEYIKIFIKEWYKDSFPQACILEYGKYNRHINNQDAHMQILILPFSDDFIKTCDRIKKDVINIAGISHISKYFSYNDSYIYYENDKDESFLVILDDNNYDHTIINHLIENYQYKHMTN